jgi:hypothetical protein
MVGQHVVDSMEKTIQSSRTFCVNCGTPNEEGLTFCHNCGAKIQTPSVQGVPAAALGSPPQMAPVYMVQAPPAKKSRKTIAIVAVVAVIAIVILLIVAASVLSAARNNNGGNFSLSPEPDIRYVSATYSQAVISGDLTVNADFTNMGDAIGTSTITIYVQETSGTYSNVGSVTLAPGQTKTVTLVVNTPFGTSIDSSMFDIYLDSVHAY